MLKQLSGVLTSWYEDRGFGFIVTDGKRQQFFVHASGIVEGPAMLCPGLLAEFDVATAFNGGKRPQAINVKLIVPAGGAK